MDYIAINQPHGVFYNSKDKISGGVRYYEAEKKIVQIKTENGQEKTVVYIDPIKHQEGKTTQLQEELASKPITPIEPKVEQIKPESLTENLAEDYNDVESRKRILAERLKEIETTLSNTNQEYRYQEQELTIQPNQRARAIVAATEAAEDEYIINIAGTAVNFSKLGIEKPYLNPENKRWLIKAQNYFIKAKEEGRAIGSAEEYTSIDILEGLWSVAESEGVDPKRFIVQIYNESRFNPFAKGDAGERGIGQFKKSTAMHYGYNWDTMTAGIETYAYQAKAAAQFVRAVGEIAYNGGGEQAERYQDLIDDRLQNIVKSPSDCVMSNIAYCNSSDS